MRNLARTRAIDLRLELDPMIVQLLTKSVSSTYSIKRAIQDILFDNDFRVGISVRNCNSVTGTSPEHSFDLGIPLGR